MTRDQRKAAVNQIKNSISLSIKPALIDTWLELREISPAEGRKLERIINRLEVWQNR